MDHRHLPSHVAGNHQPRAKRSGQLHHDYEHRRRPVKLNDAINSSLRARKNSSKLQDQRDVMPRVLPEGFSVHVPTDDRDYVRRWLAQTDDAMRLGESEWHTAKSGSLAN
jgi:hypothetical protein